jgi:uncharacterized membrane protein
MAFMKLVNWFKENYWLSIILFLGAILRFYHSDFQSIWLDEAYTMIDANPKLTLKEFYDGILYLEFMPHMYFFLLRIIFEIFGYSTEVGRIFSAVIGIFGIYAIYLLGKELFNRRSGLIAACLLAVNGFHIFYSQEMRPYGMLFLFTILAFYRLSIFIKSATVKNAIFLGAFAGLLINSHYFGFFTIFAIYLIVLFFLIKTPKEYQKKFFINAFISGLVLILFFLPTIQVLLKVNTINSFWMQAPGPNALTLMLQEFFGTSELILFLIQFIIVFYALQLFKQRITSYTSENIVKNKIIYSFIILFTWLFISLIIPLVRSYLSVPMIFSRYFVNVVPAIILIIAFGIELIRSKLIKGIVISCFILFSLIDLIVVKNYYNTPTKSQLREVTTQIINKNKEGAKVVTYWTWILPHFFENTPHIKLDGLSQSLEEYVNGMKSGKYPLKQFWHVDFNQ